MKSGWRRVAGAAGVLALVAAAAWAATSETATARQSAGTSTYTHAGRTGNVGSTTQFQENDSLVVPRDGRITIEFKDGSYLTVVGPASLAFGAINSDGRHVRLASGVISDANVHGVALEIQGPVGTDASFVLQNATGYARVAPGEKIVFQRKEGGAGNAFAKIWRGGAWIDVGDTAWSLNMRDNVATAGAGRPVAPSAPRLSPDWQSKRWKYPEWAEHPSGGKIEFTQTRTVYFTPVKRFRGEDTEAGGLRMTFIAGGEDEWGLVQVLGTKLFLADQQWVEFDQEGELIAKDAGVITRVDTGLFDAIVTDESVKDATDASPVIIHHR